jgi:hypothetical protein
MLDLKYGSINGYIRFEVLTAVVNYPNRISDDKIPKQILQYRGGGPGDR